MATSRTPMLANPLRETVRPQHPTDEPDLQDALGSTVNVGEDVVELRPQPMPRTTLQGQPKAPGRRQALRACASGQVDHLVKPKPREVGAVQHGVLHSGAPRPGHLVYSRVEVPSPHHLQPRRGRSAGGRDKEVWRGRHTPKSVKVCRALVRQRGRFTNCQEGCGQLGQRIVPSGRCEVDARVDPNPMARADAVIDDLPAETTGEALRVGEEVELIGGQRLEGDRGEGLAWAPGRRSQHPKGGSGEVRSSHQSRLPRFPPTPLRLSTGRVGWRVGRTTSRSDPSASRRTNVWLQRPPRDMQPHNPPDTTDPSRAT